MPDVALNICGLKYRVVFASDVDVPELAGKEGMTVTSSNTIYIRAGLPASRTRDTLVHEVMHAFFEASGVGSFLNDRVRGDYDKFEETLIRLLVQPMLRLIEENGRALIAVPKSGGRPAVKATFISRGKKAGARR